MALQDPPEVAGPSGDQADPSGSGGSGYSADSGYGDSDGYGSGDSAGSGYGSGDSARSGYGDSDGSGSGGSAGSGSGDSGGSGDSAGSGGGSSWGGGSSYVDDRPVGSPPEWVLPTSGASPPPAPADAAWAPPPAPSDQSEWAPPSAPSDQPEWAPPAPSSPPEDETAVHQVPSAPPWSSETGVIDIPTYGPATPDEERSPSPGVDEAAPGWSDGSSTSTVDADELSSAEVWLESDEGHADDVATASLTAPSMASPDLDELWGDDPDDAGVPPDAASVPPDVDADADDPAADDAPATDDARADDARAADDDAGPVDEAEPEAAVDPGWSAPTMPVEPPSDMPDDASELATADDGPGDDGAVGEHPSDALLDAGASPPSLADDAWLGTSHEPEVDGDDGSGAVEARAAAGARDSGGVEADAFDDDFGSADAAPVPDDLALPPAVSDATPPPMGSPPPPAPGVPPYPGYAPPGPPPSPSYAPSTYAQPPAPPSYAPPPPSVPQPPPAPPASGYGQPGYPQTPAPPAANPDPTYLGAAVQRVSPAARAAAKGALTLVAHLINGQRVEGVVIGRLRGATAVAVLTDQQLFLVNDQEWQPMVERLAVDSTLQVQGWDTGATVAMIFTSGGRPLELESIPDKQVAYEFAARIQARTGSQ